MDPDRPLDTTACDFLGVKPPDVESPALVPCLEAYGYCLVLDKDYAGARSEYERALRILETHGEDTVRVREHLGLLEYYAEDFPAVRRRRGNAHEFDDASATRVEEQLSLVHF